MEYLALYRRWRPQLFNEIVGQEHVTKTLRNAIKAGKVSHAYLFCGPRGTGKTSTAKVLARAINCVEQRDGEPCNDCRNCREILAGSTMDVIEIDAASNRGIDEIRELKENINFFPSRAGKRVYIVDEVHMLTNEAFNALLKTLEEPPAHVVFVLATTEPHKVPLTILSRCQRFDFRPVQDELIARRLEDVAEKGGFRVEPAAIRAITRAASGSLRDALSVLDQALLLGGGEEVTAEAVRGMLGTVREEALRDLTSALAEKDAGKALVLVDEIASSGHDLHLLVGELTEYLRLLLVGMLVPEGPGKTAGSGRSLFSRESLVRAIDIMVEAGQVMRRSAHPRVVLETALVRATGESGKQGYGDLLARIERLEKSLAGLLETAGGEGERSRDVAGNFTPGTPKKNAQRNVVSDDVPRDGSGLRPGDTNARKQKAGVKVKDNVERREEPVGGPGKTGMAPVETARQPDGDLTAPGGGPEPGTGTEPGKGMQNPGVDKKTEERKQGRFDIQQIMKWWPDIMNELKRVNPAVYTYLSLVWPDEVRDRCLVLGVPKDDVFSMQMAEDRSSRELLVKTLRSFTGEEWSVRCVYSDAPPPGWEGQKTELEPDEAIKLFQGEEISSPGDMMDKS